MQITFDSVAHVLANIDRPSRNLKSAYEITAKQLTPTRYTTDVLDELQNVGYQFYF